MKVAIVVPFVHEGGGVPAVAQYLCEVLSEHECQLISVSTSKSDKYSVRLLSPKSWLTGIQVHPGHWNGSSVINVGAFFTEFEFQRYMPRRELTEILNRFDVVQIVAGAPAWAYLAKHCTAPVFLQIATLVKEERRKVISNSRGLKKRYLQLSTLITSMLERKALQLVDLVFVENHWMYEHLKKLIGAEKVIMAPPGIDTAKYFPKNNKESKTPSTVKYLITVGRLNDRRKNIPLLFESYHKLRRINPTPPLLMLVGLHGPTDGDWALAKQLGIEEFIIFEHEVSQSELIARLQNAELFVSSSDEEGLGIAMMEALACGIPVVSTSCGGPETFMEDGINGYLVPKNDASRFAARIDQLLTDEPLKLRMGNSARKIMEARFSNEATGKLFNLSYAKRLGREPKST